MTFLTPSLPLPASQSEPPPDELASRGRRAFGLYGADLDRAPLVSVLWRAVSLIGADRGAVIWVDEYGPGLPHVFTLLDVVASPPRRTFSVEPLTAARRQGVPGVYDVPDGTTAGISLAAGAASLVAVAVESDPQRSWYVVLDSQTTRPPIDQPTLSQLLFLAGAASGIVTGRRAVRPTPVSNATYAERVGAAVLRDVDASTSRGEAAWVEPRLYFARFVRMLVADEFHPIPEVLASHAGDFEQVIQRAAIPVTDPERIAWCDVLAAARSLARDAEGETLRRLAYAIQGVASQLEVRGIFHGASELFEAAYRAAAAAGDLDAVVTLLHARGRVAMALQDDAGARRWFEHAIDAARAVGDGAREQAIACEWARYNASPST